MVGRAWENLRATLWERELYVDTRSLCMFVRAKWVKLLVGGVGGVPRVCMYVCALSVCVIVCVG